MSDNTANEKIDNYVASMLRLSDDIGKMADRIGDMADRIGGMADRIMETQKIQSKNLEATQEAMLETMKVISAQFKANNELMELLICRLVGGDPHVMD